MIDGRGPYLAQSPINGYNNRRIINAGNSSQDRASVQNNLLGNKFLKKHEKGNERIDDQKNSIA